MTESRVVPDVDGHACCGVPIMGQAVLSLGGSPPVPCDVADRPLRRKQREIFGKQEGGTDVIDDHMPLHLKKSSNSRSVVTRSERRKISDVGV
jgi:hypothetical protein